MSTSYKSLILSCTRNPTLPEPRICLSTLLFPYYTHSGTCMISLDFCHVSAKKTTLGFSPSILLQFSQWYICSATPTFQLILSHISGWLTQLHLFFCFSSFQLPSLLCLSSHFCCFSLLVAFCHRLIVYLFFWLLPSWECSFYLDVVAVSHPLLVSALLCPLIHCRWGSGIIVYYLPHGGWWCGLQMPEISRFRFWGAHAWEHHLLRNYAHWMDVSKFSD